MRVSSLVLAAFLLVAAGSAFAGCPGMHTAGTPATVASADGKYPVSTPAPQPAEEPRS